jgi:hypothetical protein
LKEEEKKERIRHYADWIKSLWIGVLALSGSLAGVWLNLDSGSKLFLFVAGMVVDFLFGTVIAVLHRKIERLLASLGREDL